MREGLDAPTLELPPANVEEIRSFLDGQSPIELAVWVRHEQRGHDGPLYDHHLVLGVDDEDWKTGDMRALEEGMQLPALGTNEPTWLDIYPVSEVEALRSFGTVLWEQTAAGADPLDYRFTYDPFEPESSTGERFAMLLAETPEIQRVGAAVEHLWNGGDVLRETVRLYVEAPLPTNALTVAVDAARTTVLENVRWHSASLGWPAGMRIAVLYERPS